MTHSSSDVRYQKLPVLYSLTTVPGGGNDPDVAQTKRLLIICGLSALITPIVYALTASKILALGPIAVTCLVCALIHTPLAFFFLYAALPFDMLFRFSEAFTISKFLGVVVVASYCLTRLGRHVYLPSVLKWLIVWAVFCLTSCFWAIAPMSAMRGVVTLLLHIGLIFLLVNTVTSFQMFRFLLWDFVIASAFGVCLLLMRVGTTAAGGSTERLAFEGMNPNHLGAQLGVAMIVSLYLAWSSSFQTKIINLALFGLLGTGLVYSQSRSALFACLLAIGGGLILLMQRRRKFIYLGAFMALCAIGVAGYQYLLSSEILGEKATERMQSSPSALQESGRLHFWKEGLRYLSERPLHGYGFKNFPIRYGKGFAGKDAHNTYVSLAAELGVVGLFLFLIVHYLLFKTNLAISIPTIQWLCQSLLIFTVMNGMTHTTHNQKELWYAFGFIVVITHLYSKRPLPHYAARATS